MAAGSEEAASTEVLPVEIAHRGPRLREAIRTKIRAGVLTRDACAKGWYARGRGRPCEACALVIDETQVECEGHFSDGTTLRFHQACFAIWNDERTSARERGEG